MRVFILVAASLLGALASAPPALSQCSEDVAPCQALVELRNSDARGALQKLAGAAREVGYEPSSVTWSEGHFVAVRQENENLQHRVLIQVAWHLQQPNEVLRVYLTYGKFRRFTGGEFERLEVSQREQILETQALRNRILELARF